MRYVTDIGRFLFTYGDLKDGQMLDCYLLLGRAAPRASSRFLPNTAFLTAISEPQFRKINGYDVMGIFLP
jgi:hypothetical protein